MDDRFDFQLITEEFDDGEGLSLIDGSYHAFGNNGTTYDKAINNASNTVTFPGVTSHTKSQILNALATVTDHIPVVVDYQVPALMSAVAGAIPTTLDFEQVFNLDVTVHNAANVVAANGADELDYDLTAVGDVVGSFLNQVDMALGGTNVHQIAFDTATLGQKSGTIIVQSASQAAQNSLVNIPVSYLVVSGLDGDYNNDGFVDAADYSVWRNNLGAADELKLAFQGDGGDVGLTDYDVWRRNYGNSLPGPGAGGFASSPNQAVPEPVSWLPAAIGCCMMGGRRVRLRAWTRPK
jgi:hypothetical protein